ncbi:hypothetical protein A9Q99_01370 [Gammaproteobacteria bacterium 45_16_T64]|nr:hypothetical protein A9Q99_01370 [Gammaproteobacteria bacterium 45_16_T64]
MNNIEKDIELWAKKYFPVYEFMDLKNISSSHGIYQCFTPLSANTGNHISTIHAAFQWATAELLGGLVVLCNRTNERYIPVVKNLHIDFLAPALTGVTSTVYFTEEDVTKMNAALENSGRYDFELKSEIRGEDDQVVSRTRGNYAVRVFEK